MNPTRTSMVEKQLPEKDSGMEKLWTYEDLMVRWGVGERQARRICELIGLKSVPMGHRTVRFRPVAVMAAEERAEGRGAPAAASRATEFRMPERRRRY